MKLWYAARKARQEAEDKLAMAKNERLEVESRCHENMDRLKAHMQEQLQTYRSTADMKLQEHVINFREQVMCGSKLYVSSLRELCNVNRYVIVANTAIFKLKEAR